jgi:hypothetical protein
MIKIIKPDTVDQESLKDSFKIFLAGSIEMGLAENWQEVFIDVLNKKDANLTIFNPRRDNWDSSWEQNIDNPNLNYQVNWELDKLELSDSIIMYFDPKTKSPISLLELGLFATSNKLFVICPDGFWRKGNVEIVCHRNKIPLFNTIEESLEKYNANINRAY